MFGQLGYAEGVVAVAMQLGQVLRAGQPTAAIDDIHILNGRAVLVGTEAIVAFYIGVPSFPAPGPAGFGLRM